MQDRHGQTALMLAIQNDHIDGRLLLENGAKGSINAHEIDTDRQRLCLQF